MYRTSTFKQYKYGVELPRSYKHALQLDEQNGNKSRQAAINKKIDQMINKFKAFCILKDGNFYHLTVRNFDIISCLM